MSEFSEKSFTATIEDTQDGSGDRILTIPPEISKEFGWKEGTLLNIELENNVIILTEIKNVQNNTTST